MATRPEQAEFLRLTSPVVEGVAVEGSHLHGLVHAESDVDLTVFLSSKVSVAEFRKIERRLGVEARYVHPDSFAKYLSEGATWLTEVMLLPEDILWREDSRYRTFYLGHSLNLYQYSVNLRGAAFHLIESALSRVSDEKYFDKKMKGVSRNLVQSQKLSRSMFSDEVFTPTMSEGEAEAVWSQVPAFRDFVLQNHELGASKLVERLWDSGFSC